LHIGGNVAEWCQDWYAPYENGPITDPVQTNQNLSDKPRRVLRGGSWNRDPKNTRSAARFRADARSRNADIGFRIVAATALTPAPPAESEAPLLPRSQPRSSTTSSQPGPPAVPPSAQGHESTATKPQGTFFDAVFGFVCCIGLPLLVLGGAIYVIVKKAGRNASVPTAPGGGTTAKAVADALSKPSLIRGMPKIRIADDGFWMLLDVLQDSPIEYVFRPKGGMEARGTVNYQPGPQGQFVYTGVRPESVRVVSAGGVPMDDVFTSGSSSPSPLSSDRRDDDNSPPRYPSAY
jgi:hypothetical protein